MEGNGREQTGETKQKSQGSFQSSSKKTAGQKAKPGQKKRNQPKQSQKENSFTGQKEKPKSDNPQGNVKNGFTKEENAFMEGNRREQTGEAKQKSQSSSRKTAGKKAESGQKKRNQPKKPPKENGFTGQKEKPESGNPQGNEENSFSKEENIFSEDSGQKQTEETKDFKDDYRRKDTYHQSEKKGRYKRREHKQRERTKKFGFERGFQTKDSTFSESNIFTEGAEPEFQGSKKLEKLQDKAEKAAKRTQKAREKLPKKKEYSLKRVFDEKTGRAKYVLTAVEKEKPFKADNPVKHMVGRIGSEYTNFAHGKVAEVEKDNSAVEGAHKTEQKAEGTYRFVKRHYKWKEQRQREKVARLEKKQFKSEVNFRYQKFLEENPKMQEKTVKKQIQKRIQKQRIKREYAKARRAGQAAKSTKEAAVKSANFTTAVAKKIQEMAAEHASILVAVGAFAILLIMIMTSISSCGAMFSEGMSVTLAGSYMSDLAEIDAADLAFSELELELQKKINSIETDYPDYDEYRYNLDATGHDPFALISYLSAVYTEFTAADVQAEIGSLFAEMYELTLNPTTETRTRTVTRTGTRIVTNADGTTSTQTYTYEVEEEYTVTMILSRLVDIFSSRILYLCCFL